MRKSLFAAVLLSALPLLAQQSAEDLIPNHIKYKDSGLQPAKGRSGSASIEARALLGQDGTTTIEATTGSFDSTATAPGSIDRLQIKQSPDSENAITTNVDTHGSFISIPVTGLGWREQIQLQTKVSGIDASRTDIVTMRETVKRRPNLAIDVRSPMHAVAGLPYSVNMIIFELNRDIGARVTAVMRVNGVVVDRAENLWVDAGGRVVCNFLHAFDTAGPQQVEYALIDQSPADWADYNNHASITVNVYSSATEMTSWDLDASESTREMHGTGYSSSGGWLEEGGETYEKVISQRTSFHGLIAGPFDITQLQGSFYERTNDGAPVYELPNAGCYPPGPWVSDGCRFSDRRYAYMTVCTNGGFTSVEYFRGSADVVYISKEWWRVLRPDGTWASYGYVISMPRKVNWKEAYGDAYSFEFRLSDGSQLFEAARSMQLSVDGPNETVTSNCYEYGDTTGCWTRKETVTTKSATASHNQVP